MFMTLNEEKSQNFKKKKYKLTDISDKLKIKTGQIDPEQYMRVKACTFNSHSAIYCSFLE